MRYERRYEAMPVIATEFQFGTCSFQKELRQATTCSITDKHGDLAINILKKLRRSDRYGIKRAVSNVMKEEFGHDPAI